MLAALGALAKDMEQANLLATLILIVMMILDGTWVSLERLGPLQWIKYLSFMGLAVQAATKSEFTGLTFDCPTEANQAELLEEICIDPSAADSNQIAELATGCYTTGEQVLAM